MKATYVDAPFAMSSSFSLSLPFINAVVCISSASPLPETKDNAQASSKIVRTWVLNDSQHGLYELIRLHREPTSAFGL